MSTAVWVGRAGWHNSHKMSRSMNFLLGTPSHDPGAVLSGILLTEVRTTSKIGSQAPPLVGLINLRQPPSLPVAFCLSPERIQGFDRRLPAEFFESVKRVRIWPPKSSALFIASTEKSSGFDGIVWHSQ
ncbi:hypothetical protein BDM02DRAFT_3120131 [Thelephora ganbajun]|uniref:Uncharacterized protein n=1 Tax=Thelephora ganbajun TaxID=370292 RepID=A0ACB6Z7N0_THEGA|nr:hypothetical protein BDM02DRAFT_3120131 [Thelephora ganbajun]